MFAHLCTLRRWFKTQPSVQDKFRLFAGKSPEELKNSARLTAHATKIFNGINEVIVCRNKPGAVKELLNDIKRDHMHRKVARGDNDVRSL